MIWLRLINLIDRLLIITDWLHVKQFSSLTDSSDDVMVSVEITDNDRNYFETIYMYISDFDSQRLSVLFSENRGTINSKSSNN